jgi:hypothetical protein
MDAILCKPEGLVTRVTGKALIESAGGWYGTEANK